MLPIVSQHPVSISEDERREIAALAAGLLANQPGLAGTTSYGPRVRSGLAEGPTLTWEDHAGLALFGDGKHMALGQRAMLLAGDGDIVAVGGPRHPAFEDYCRHRLGLGRVEVVCPTAGPQNGPLATRCGADPGVFDRLVKLASAHGTINLLPYLAADSAWRLAGSLARRTGASAQVVGPPPALTRAANDKLWFARRITELLGWSALPPTWAAFSPGLLAARVVRIARAHRRVVVKVPSSAGSEGNLVLGSSAIRGLSSEELRGQLLRRLAALGHDGSFPLLVGAWETDALTSPSVQLWIPARDEGGPIVEGLFTQAVEGQGGRFVGALPCLLPDALTDTLLRQGVALGTLLQELGWFGRCSLDALVVGSRLETATVHWVECNGRWGGVSIPMTLANRLVGDWRGANPVIVQRTGLLGAPRPLERVLDLLEPLLFGPHRSEGVVVLTPGEFVQGTGITLLAMSGSQERSFQLITESRAVLGLYPLAKSA